MNCDWQSTDEPGRYRCGRCGFLMPAAQAYPMEKVLRRCDVIDLDGVSLPRIRPHAKAWNVTKAIASWVTSGFGKVSKQQYVARLKVCDSCPLRSGNLCTVCGCHLTAKAIATAWHCPLGKWSNDPGPDPEVVERLVQYQSRPNKSLLIVFPHGFGDAVQLTTVLLHLRRLYPGWSIDVECKRGADSLFHSMVRETFVFDTATPKLANRNQYTIHKTLPWWEPDQCYADSAGTKAERCLRETFAIEPIEELCRYEIQPNASDFASAETYLNSLPCERLDGGRWPVVLLHYQGNSARAAKNLNEQIVGRVVDVILRHGLLPVILDWEQPFRSRLIDQRTVFCPTRDNPLWQGLGTGDGATLAALIQRASMLVGIDSGPEHVAAATTTPTLIVWRRHHPYHYFGLAENVTHLIPPGADNLLRGDHQDAGKLYFERHYRFQHYERNLRIELPGIVNRFIGHMIDKPIRHAPANDK